MDKTQQQKNRRAVLGVIAVSTLCFFLALGAGIYLHQRLPQMRLQRVETALAAGNTDDARRLIARLDDEAAAQEYLARCDYLDAAELFSRGDYAAARALFGRAGNYADAAELVKRCDYAVAEERFSAGDFNGAEESFRALGGYVDAADRVLECRYAEAEALAGAGQAVDAAELFASLGAYGDAPARLAALAVEITGVADAQEAVAALRGLSREQLERQLAVTQAREALPRAIIAVGFYHTVGLNPDGTVTACGNNDYGQCDVGALRSVTAVAAGAYHTAALHADGTVSVVGRSGEGQADTTGWKNVVQIAAADYATFGLTAEGTLLCAGYNDYSETADWTGLAQVAGGSYNLGCLRADGTVWLSPELAGTEALQGAAALDVSTGYAVAAMADGSVVSTAYDLSGWQDVVSLSAGTTAILGLDAQGHVLARFFREKSPHPDFSGLNGAVAVAAGGTHFAVVFADGSVTVLGESDHGQADTAGWRLAVNG